MTALRERAIDALFAFAVVERDSGGAGYAEGLAQRLDSTDQPVSEAYVDGIEAAVALVLLRGDIESVHVADRCVRAMRDGRWGCYITLPSAEDAEALAARLAGCSTT